MSNGHTTRCPPSAGRRLEQVIYTEPIATSVSRTRSRKNSSKQPLHHRSLRHIYRMTLTTPTTPYTKEAATNSSVYDVKPTRYVNFTPCLVEGETTGIHRQQTRTTTQHLQQSLCVDGEDPRFENPGGEVPMCLIDYRHLLLENNHIDGENPRIMEKPFRRQQGVIKEMTTSEIHGRTVITPLCQISEAPANILKGISNGKDIWAETTINRARSMSKLTSKDGKLHIHNFKSESHQEGRVHTVQYENLLSHLPKQPPTLVFLDITYHTDDYKGRVYIRLEPELHDFIKHLPDIFTGEHGNSILGNTGTYGYDFGIWIKQRVNEVSSFNGKPVAVNSGAVLCNIDGDSIRAIFLYLESARTYGSHYAKLGHVVSGLEVVKACRALGRDQQNKITISDCGIVLES